LKFKWIAGHEVDRMEVKLGGDQEDQDLDGGQPFKASGATPGGLEQAVEGREDAVGLVRVSPAHDAAPRTAA